MTHSELVSRAVKWLRNSRGCLLVLSECRGMGQFEEMPDAIGWTWRGVSILIECKVSAEDFCRDFRKPFRRGEWGMGSLRYYLTTKDVTLPYFPRGWGLLIATPKTVREIVTPEPRVGNSMQQGELNMLLHRCWIVEHGIMEFELGGGI